MDHFDEQPFYQLDFQYGNLFFRLKAKDLGKVLICFGVLYLENRGLLADITLNRTIMDQILDLPKGALDVMLRPISSLIALGRYPQETSLDQTSSPDAFHRVGFHIFHPFLYDFLLDPQRSGGFYLNLATVYQTLGKYHLTRSSESNYSGRREAKASKNLASKSPNPESNIFTQSETLRSLEGEELKLQGLVDLTAKCGHPATSLAHDLLQIIRSKMQAEHISDVCMAVVIQAELILGHVNMVLNIDPESDRWDLGPILDIGVHVLPSLEGALQVSIIQNIHKPPQFMPSCEYIFEDLVNLERVFSLRKAHLDILSSLEASAGGQRNRYFGVHDSDSTLSAISVEFERMKSDVDESRYDDLPAQLLSKTLQTILDTLHQAKLWDRISEASFLSVVKSSMLLLYVYRGLIASNAIRADASHMKEPSLWLIVVNLVQALGEHISSGGSPPLGHGRAHRFLNLLSEHLTLQPSDMDDVRSLVQWYIDSAPPSTSQTGLASLTLESFFQNFSPISALDVNEKVDLQALVLSASQPSERPASLGQLLGSLRRPTLPRWMMQGQLQQYLSESHKLQSTPGRQAVVILARSLGLELVEHLEATPSNDHLEASADINNTDGIEDARSLLRHHLLAPFKWVVSEDVLLNVISSVASIQIRWKWRTVWLLKHIGYSSDNTIVKTELLLQVIDLVKSMDTINWFDSTPEVLVERVEVYHQWTAVTNSQVEYLRTSGLKEQISLFEAACERDEKEYETLRPFLPSPSIGDWFRVVRLLLKRDSMVLRIAGVSPSVWQLLL
ncbi:hypothetical protein CPB83DRAFT_833357 [Crepidotus variabilis]|uniref:Uncharacterized protein n=1 Tax=Crepidotus variabilis TaxID=179855 RepID=A0A9P6EMK5_9AGAR|nr:hypothetical protein CPB83DRAFT_833357 [Crepidotus variabilis]